MKKETLIKTIISLIFAALVFFGTYLEWLAYPEQLTQDLLYLNEISDVSRLTSCINLKTIWLYENNVSDISSLKTLTNLEMFNLFNDKRAESSNKINDENLEPVHIKALHFKRRYAIMNT